MHAAGILRITGAVSRVRIFGTETVSRTDDEIVIALPTDRSLLFTRLAPDDLPDRCIVSIHSDLVSKRHSQIVFEHGGFWLQDLRSTGGSYVNDCKLTRPHALADGDVIELANCQLRFERR